MSDKDRKPKYNISCATSSFLLPQRTCLSSPWRELAWACCVSKWDRTPLYLYSWVGDQFTQQGRIPLGRLKNTFYNNSFGDYCPDLQRRFYFDIITWPSTSMTSPNRGKTSPRGGTAIIIIIIQQIYNKNIFQSYVFNNTNPQL